MVTSANKIVSLVQAVDSGSQRERKIPGAVPGGCGENANEEHIAAQYSTSKLGWIRGGFLPYDSDIVFDGDAKFRQISESVRGGNRNRWYEYISGLRKSGRIEIKFMLAAFFPVF